MARQAKQFQLQRRGLFFNVVGSLFVFGKRSYWGKCHVQQTSDVAATPGRMPGSCCLRRAAPTQHLRISEGCRWGHLVQHGPTRLSVSAFRMLRASVCVDTQGWPCQRQDVGLSCCLSCSLLPVPGCFPPVMCLQGGWFYTH